ncbi:MAG: hypothetical protein J5833_09270, partial [Victivallales bacterium]|nr:hypothetical protein [Victivallales bacterium]
MFTLDMTSLDPSDTPIVGSLSELEDTEFKATLSAEQPVGTYSLVGGASGFTGGVQICLDSGICIGRLGVNDGFCYEGVCYSLLVEGGTLKLIVCGDETEYTSGVAVSSGGVIVVSSGSAIVNAEVASNGVLRVLGGGAVSSATVTSGGTLTVSKGGNVADTAVGSGGSMLVANGAHLTGSIDASGTITVSGEVDALATTFTFNVSGRKVSDGYILNDLSLLQGAEFSIIVDAFQNVGTYRLAGNAGGFVGDVSVCTNNGVCFGTITVGSGACFGNYCYTVNVDDDGMMTLDVAISDITRSEVVLPYTMPQAEYMYGCVPTSLAMLLGYYDKYGYLGYDVSDLITGDISVYSRATDGNAYD